MSQPTQTSQPTQAPQRRAGSAKLLLLSFALGAFALGTSENVVAGILSDVARGIGVSEGSAGLLVTAYAGTVTVAGPVLTLFLDRIAPKKLLVGAMTLYLAGSLLAAVSTTFAVAVLARVLTGLVHTTILVIFMTTAMRLAAPEKQASAAANITLGLSVATVLGVPIGVSLGQHVAWQAAFVLVAVLCAISLVLIVATFPPDTGDRPAAGGSRLSNVRGLGRPQVAFGIATTALTGMAALTVVTFVAPFLTQGSDIGSSMIVWIMLAYGVGCVLGNTVGARLANRQLVQAMAITVSATLATLVLMSLLPGNAVATVVLVVLLGFTYFATFPALNTWVAKNSEDLSPNLALALNSSAFNIGIAFAGWVGSLYLNSAHSITHLPVLALPAAALGSVIAWLLFRAYGSSRSRPAQNTARQRTAAVTAAEE
ncbi:MFS transporter [Streptomyces sp. NPDC006660]|uniref:MFS transporter n=1 Tax=Streptomyces sp. NPDC006660 TaxID=3156901 RepID=UPI0033C2FE26